MGEWSVVDAAQQIGRTQAAVRSAARWHGWVWLAMALLSSMFVLAAGTETFGRAVAFWLVVVFGAVAGSLGIWDPRRRVVGRETARIDDRVTVFYAATLLGSFALVDQIPEGWWPVVAMLVVVPAVPCLYAAWRILRR